MYPYVTFMEKTGREKERNLAKETEAGSSYFRPIEERKAAAWLQLITSYAWL
jgi:hypothetical protein